MCKKNCVNNQNSTKKPFGYIYLATNTFTGKVYIGETVKPIRKRWLEHLTEGRAVKRLRIEQPHKKIFGSRLNNAIAKYDESVWKLEQIDVAYSQEELDEKEKHWIKEYDSTHREKGYNMTDGGVGSQSEEVIKKIRDTLKRKYQTDAEYRKWMINFNRKGREEVEKLRREDPEFRKRMRDKLIRGNKDPVLRAKRSATMKKIMDEKYKDPEYKKRIGLIIAESNRRRKIKIPDIGKFLEDIKSGLKTSSLAVRYKMSEDTVRLRVKEILGKYGINNPTEAKKFLQDKDIDEIMEEIDK